MVKQTINPNTTLYPVPVVLITSGGDHPNVMTCNRISSCSAEPPRLAISIRPSRYTHTLIQESGEFVVSLPTSDQLSLTDYLGVVTGRDEDKIAVAGLRFAPASKIRTPLLADFPVNIECTVESTLDLGSHTLFIGLVQAVHANVTILDADGNIDVKRAQGLVYESGVVRERPTYNFKVDELRKLVIQVKQ